MRHTVGADTDRSPWLPRSIVQEPHTPVFMHTRTGLHSQVHGPCARTAIMTGQQHKFYGAARTAKLHIRMIIS